MELDLRIFFETILEVSFGLSRLLFFSKNVSNVLFFLFCRNDFFGHGISFGPALGR